MTVVELELLILRPTLSIVSNDLLSFLGSAYPFNLQFLYLLALFPRPLSCDILSSCDKKCFSPGGIGLSVVYVP